MGRRSESAPSLPSWSLSDVLGGMRTVTLTLLICGIACVQSGIGCRFIVVAHVVESAHLLRTGLAWWGLALLALSCVASANTLEVLP